MLLTHTHRHTQTHIYIYIQGTLTDGKAQYS